MAWSWYGYVNIAVQHELQGVSHKVCQKHQTRGLACKRVGKVPDSEPDMLYVSLVYSSLNAKQLAPRVAKRVCFIEDSQTKRDRLFRGVPYCFTYTQRQTHRTSGQSKMS